MKKIFILGLIIRLICLYLFKNVTNYDLQSYIKVGELTLKGINVYPDIANLHHPYFPFFLYVEAAASHIGQISLIRPIGPMGSILIIKFINILFDLGIAYMVYLLSKKNLKTVLLYAINPVTILITTLHGQFDVIPVFFILLSIYLLNKKQEFLSVLSFSLSIVSKTWPILFIILLARKIKNKRLLILIILLPALFCFYYSFRFKTPILNIIATVLNYQGLWGIWGPMSLIRLMRPIGPIGQKLFSLIFVASLLTYSYFKKKENFIEEILRLLFFFFVFTTGFSIQYLTWIMPFLIIIKPKGFLTLIFLMTIYLFSFYYFWLFCVNCQITLSWLVLIQNLTGIILWLSFIKVWYLSKKKS
jgi:hypothetical protein